MKTLLLALVSILSFCAADPVYGFWPGIFLSIILYVEVHKRISDNNKYQWALAAGYSFIFYFTIKLFTIRGLQSGFVSLYGDENKGSISFLVFILVESLFPALCGLGMQLLFKKRDHWLFPFLLLVLLFFNNLYSYIWIPQGLEIPLSQSPDLLSVVGLSHIKGLLIWFYSVTLWVNFYSWKKLPRNMAMNILFILWLMVPFLAGNLRKHFIVSAGKRSTPILLVQTNQSELKEKLNPVDWDKVHTEMDSRLRDPNWKYIFFPEYTSKSDNPYLEKFIKFTHGIKADSNIYIGIESQGKNGIHNEIWQFKGAEVSARFSKRIAFPIGETEINLPLLPSDWTKPRIAVESSNNSDIPLVNDIQLIPLICYEAAISDHYYKVATLTDSKRPSVFVNFSKDSHLQGSSALDWLDYFVRLKSSEYGKTTIRISTNSYTEVILPWGEILTRSEKDQFQVVETDLPVFNKTYSLWSY